MRVAGDHELVATDDRSDRVRRPYLACLVEDDDVKQALRGQQLAHDQWRHRPAGAGGQHQVAGLCHEVPNGKVPGLLTRLRFQHRHLPWEGVHGQVQAFRNQSANPIGGGLKMFGVGGDELGRDARVRIAPESAEPTFGQRQLIEDGPQPGPSKRLGCCLGIGLPGNEKIDQGAQPDTAQPLQQVVDLRQVLQDRVVTHPP